MIMGGPGLQLWFHARRVLPLFGISHVLDRMAAAPGGAVSGLWPIIR